MRRRISNNVNYSVVSPATGGSSRVGLTDADLKAKLRADNNIQFEGLQYEQVLNYVSGDVSNVAYDDRVMEEGTDVIYNTNGVLTPVFTTVPSIDPAWQYKSHDTRLATIDSNGGNTAGVTYAGDGEVFLSCESRGLGLSDGVYVTMQQTNEGGAYSKFSDFSDGSLGKHCRTEITDDIGAATPSASTMQVFSSLPGNQDTTGYRYQAWTDSGYSGLTFNETYGADDAWVRNTSLWLDADITAVSAGWKPSGSTKIRRCPNATMISPYHWISCHHDGFYPANGASLLFVDNDNNVESTEVLGSYQIGGTDIRIGIVDTAVTAAITPMKFILQSDVEDKSTFAQDARGYMDKSYGFRITQHRIAVPVVWYSAAERIDTAASDFALWQTDIFTGDSGMPNMVLVNGEAALGFCNYSALSGPAAGDFLAEIRSTMDLLSTEHSKTSQTATYPQTVDVSEFTSY